MPAFYWILVSLACMMVEFVRAGFWFLWVAIAGLFTALGVKFGLWPAITSQIIAFSAFSFILIFFIRPLVLKAIKKSSP